MLKVILFIPRAVWRAHVVFFSNLFSSREAVEQKQVRRD